MLAKKFVARLKLLLYDRIFQFQQNMYNLIAMSTGVPRYALVNMCLYVHKYFRARWFVRTNILH
jgi:hypothetical protein